MLILLSPSKTLGRSAPPTGLRTTQPQRLSEAETLATITKTLSPATLQSMMNISDKLARLTYERFQAFTTPVTPQNASCALFTFQGDVYDGLDAATLTTPQVQQAQAQLRILSGLYGLLRPLDLMQPYRLEMGIRLKNPAGNSLYDFWRSPLVETLNKEIRRGAHKTIINLASEEYFKAVHVASLKTPVVHIVFKESRNGTMKIIGLMAKKARGRMARWIIEQQPTTPAALEQFDLDGYSFRRDLSTRSTLTFVRAS